MNRRDNHRLFFAAHLLYKGAKKGEHMNRTPQRDGRLDDSPLVPATATDTDRNGRPRLALVPEYIPAEVSLENLGYFTPSSKRIKNIEVKAMVRVMWSAHDLRLAP